MRLEKKRQKSGEIDKQTEAEGKTVKRNPSIELPKQQPEKTKAKERTVNKSTPPKPNQIITVNDSGQSLQASPGKGQGKNHHKSTPPTTCCISTTMQPTKTKNAQKASCTARYVKEM